MQQKWYQKSWGIILLLLSLLILFTSCSQQNNTKIKINKTQEVSKKKAATVESKKVHLTMKPKKRLVKA